MIQTSRHLHHWHSDFIECHLPSCLDQNPGVILDSLFHHAPHSIHREMLLALVLKSIQNSDSSCLLLPPHQWPTVISCLKSTGASLKVSLCPLESVLLFQSFFSAEHTEEEFNYISQITTPFCRKPSKNYLTEQSKINQIFRKAHGSFVI